MTAKKKKPAAAVAEETAQETYDRASARAEEHLDEHSRVAVTERHRNRPLFEVRIGLYSLPLAESLGDDRLISILSVLAGLLEFKVLNSKPKKES